MSNTELWDKLGKTDPAHTKTFKRAGGFSGTAIKPMWSYRRMTEEFGPCGKGWGIYEPSFQVVPTGDTVLVFCTVSVWYEKPGQIVFGVGGDMAAGKRGQHSVVDDEAFKKAFTDAVTNALKLIGVGADVHMGMFDDNKYVNAMSAEFSATKANDDKPAQASKAASRPAYASLEADMFKLKSTADLARWWRDDDVKALREKLPDDWHRQLHNRFKEYGLELKAKEQDTVDAIKDQFPGAKVKDERFNEDQHHPLLAGE